MVAYAITDPKYLKLRSTNDTMAYLEKLQKADWVLFRDKQTHDYDSDAKLFLQYTKNRKFKVLLHQDFRLAHNYNVWGVHLTSQQFSDIPKAKALKLFVVVSTHSLEEIHKAKALGADAATFSPVFKTPNKGEPKGVRLLKKATQIEGINIIALGGIVTDEHIAKLSSSGAYGYASIRYFVNHL